MIVRITSIVDSSGMVEVGAGFKLIKFGLQIVLVCFDFVNFIIEI